MEFVQRFKIWEDETLQGFGHGVLFAHCALKPRSNDLKILQIRSFGGGYFLSNEVCLVSWEPLSPAFFLVVSAWACLVIQQRADQGRGLLGVRAQVGRQDHAGRHSSSLGVDGQL